MQSGVVSILLAACLAAKVYGIATSNTTSQFYGYGSGIGGLPLIYAAKSNASTGLAFLGTQTPDGMDSAVNVTLTYEEANTTMIVKPLNANTSWSSALLYINNDDDSCASAGFVDQNSSANTTSLTTEGFSVWGRYLIWIDSKGHYTSKWYVDPVSPVGTYSVRWNVASRGGSASLPIVLKNLAPPSL